MEKNKKLTSMFNTHKGADHQTINKLIIKLDLLDKRVVLLEKQIKGFKK